MKNHNPKFRAKTGLLTMYSYSCGYIDTKEIDAENRATLELDCIFHVKGFFKGVHFWKTFERNDVKGARKFYNNCLRG